MSLRGAMLISAGLVAGCEGPPDTAPMLDSADPARGRLLAQSKGCTACHSFPDIDFPRGRLGPSLDGFADQGLIAGQVPNQPGNLMRFVRNAPAFVPGSAMPAIAMTDQDARDVSAYLLTLRSR